MKIELLNPNNYTIPDITVFQTWCDLVGRHTKTPSHSKITICIVDETESAELNSSYRKKSGPTNILSFPYEMLTFEDEPILGDLAICAPLVQQEANQQHKLLPAHWAHLTIHGILHLLGFDHIDEQDATVMEQLEILMLAELGFSNPYEPTDT